jgi:hypothetical protein
LLAKPDGTRDSATVFRETLPFIERALVSSYRLVPEEAADVEQNLLDWFDRFCRRPGSATQAESLRGELLLMACRAGHVMSVSKLGDALPEDEDLRRTLSLGPEIIAMEIQTGIAEKRRPETDS